MDVVNPEIIAYNSRLLRALVGWSILDLASGAGLSTETIKRAEDRNIPYSKKSAMAICYAIEHALPIRCREQFQLLTGEKVDIESDWEFDYSASSNEHVMILQTNLRKLRLKFGLGQRELGRMAGMTGSRICEYESMARRNITPDIYQRLDAIFLELSSGESHADLRQYYILAKQFIIKGTNPPPYMHIGKPSQK